MAQAIDENPALRPAGKLQSKKTFTGRMPAYPTGCAICEVEIDPHTGAIAIPRYGSIDDAGQAINPLILHGQVHGGIVQGVGQALLEDVRYGDSGQVLTGSFMDYAIPARATCRRSTSRWPRTRPRAIRCGSRAAARPASRRRWRSL